MGNILGSTISLAAKGETPAADAAAEADVEAAEPAEEPAEGEAAGGSTSSSATTQEEEEQPGVVLPVRASLPPPKFGDHITVLSIDGGGIRGLIPAVVLQRLEEKLQLAEKELHHREENVRIADYFDVVAGTSTGALITAMLVTPGNNDRPKYTAEEIKDFYVKNGSKIFPPKSWWWKGPLSMIRTLWGAKYHGTFLHNEIKRKVGEITLDKTLCKIVVPTFDVNRMEPVIFTSYRKLLMVQVRLGLSDICIGTSAAPTFFPAHNFKTKFIDGNKDKDYHLIDGGVAANNPTMSAISTVTKEQLMKNKDFGDDRVDYSRYLVISIGTGSAVNAQPVYTAKGCAKWGALGWAHNWRNGHSPIIDIFSNASAVLVDWHVAMLLHNGDREGKQNYLRIQAQLTKDMPMDDATPDNIQSLVNVGNDLMAKKVHMVNLFTGRYQEDITRLRTNDEELRRLAWLLVQERARRFDRVKEEAKAKAEAAGRFDRVKEEAKAKAEAAEAEAEAEAAAEDAAAEADAEAEAEDRVKKEAKAKAEAAAADAAAEADAAAIAAADDEDAADTAAEAEALAAETDEELEHLFRLLVQERARRIARQRAANVAAEAEAAEPAAEPAEAEAPAADAAAEAEAAEPTAEPAEAEAPAADAAAEAAQQRRRKAAEAEAPAADAAAEAEAAACACPRPNIGL